VIRPSENRLVRCAPRSSRAAGEKVRIRLGHLPITDHLTVVGAAAPPGVVLRRDRHAGDQASAPRAFLPASGAGAREMSAVQPWIALARAHARI
jgi:hypothetical protein